MFYRGPLRGYLVKQKYYTQDFLFVNHYIFVSCADQPFPPLPLGIVWIFLFKYIILFQIFRFQNVFWFFFCNYFLDLFLTFCYFFKIVKTRDSFWIPNRILFQYPVLFRDPLSKLFSYWGSQVYGFNIKFSSGNPRVNCFNIHFLPRLSRVNFVIQDSIH